jgi:hypothetical protein
MAFAHDQIKLRAVIFLRLFPHGPPLRQKFTMPMPAHSRQFYLLLSEAARLTDGASLRDIAIRKEAQRPAKVRGRESGQCSGSDQLGLIFWLLLDQAKSNSRRGK